MQKGCLAPSLFAQMTEGNLRTESARTTDSVGHSRKQTGPQARECSPGLDVFFPGFCAKLGECWASQGRRTTQEAEANPVGVPVGLPCRKFSTVPLK